MGYKVRSVCIDMTVEAEDRRLELIKRAGRVPGITCINGRGA